ncbi:hypothetical protein OQH61_01020 [Helicobacter sp. MIT 21-1697]|uniref:hypothetical protein n=1 Tax=Helicobacter sp. MIT 21-1697 TaxID=2993733 RepID=UPI00224B68DD|nr:hypothetical protein [Helicobacter sp. MIT 21-1697]MCX2716321.1 hypothetical protein [Helicobacter sp. MIT 21-1697]
MNKIFISLALVLSLGTASLVAAQVQPQTQEVQKLNKADAELLFGKQDVNVALLSDEEMEETQGEFWIALGAISSAISAGKSVYDLGKDKGWWK